jgi:hypothetical protein
MFTCWKPSPLTGGGGGQGFSAFGGAIEAGRIRALGVLTGVVCHRGKEKRRGGAGQIYLIGGSRGEKSEYGRKQDDELDLWVSTLLLPMGMLVS